MKKKLNLIIFVLITLTLFGCGSTNDGQQCAEKFLTLMIQEKLDSAVTMLENNDLDYQESINTLKGFRGNSEYGELISFEKNFGFSTKMRNGITTVELPYELTYGNKRINSTITMIDRGNGFKIYSID